MQIVSKQLNSIKQARRELNSTSTLFNTVLKLCETSRCVCQAWAAPMKTRNLVRGGEPTPLAPPPCCWRRCLKWSRPFPKPSRFQWAAAPRWATWCRASPTRCRRTCPRWRSPSPNPPPRPPTAPRRRSGALPSRHVPTMLCCFPVIKMLQ